MDWQRGEIPYYTLPPDYKETLAEENIDHEKIEQMNMELNNEKLAVIIADHI